MRMRWLARLLRPRLIRWAIRTEPNFQVIRDDDRVYLRRWWLLPRNKWCNLYLHNMLGDDEAVLHDHPYYSLSLALTDGLHERYNAYPAQGDFPAEGRQLIAARDIGEGRVTFRNRHFAHQLLVVRHSAWTLFLTGPRVREWGFWCPRGWRPWHKYVAASQDPSVNRGDRTGTGRSRVGAGCGEET